MTNVDKIRKDLRDFAKSLDGKAYRIPIDPGNRRGGKLDELWIVNGHGIGIIILEDGKLITNSQMATSDKIRAAKGFVFVLNSSSFKAPDWFKSFIYDVINGDYYEDDGDDE